MKVFLFKLIVFLLLPLSIFFGSCEIYFTQQGNSYLKKKEIIETQIEQTNIIVAGSSHGLYGVNTDLFKTPALNFSNVSQDIYYSSRLIRKYLDQASSLKTVILIVSASTLDGLLENGTESWRSNFYKKVFNIGRYNGEPFLSLSDSFYTLIYYDHLFQYLRRGLPNSDAQGITRTGFAPIAKINEEQLNKNINIESGIKRATRHSSKDSSYRPINIEIIDHLIKDLRSKGINVALVTLPAYKTYTGAFDPSWIQNVFTTYQEIAKKHNVDYINLWKDSRFQKEDFSDNDHLNEEGASKLTKILIKKLEK